MTRLTILAALLPAAFALPQQQDASQFLSETDSLGRVTGLPTIPALPPLPPLPTLATIPAGFSEGVTTVWVAPSTYAVISVHDGSTDVISAITTKSLSGVPAGAPKAVVTNPADSSPSVTLESTATVTSSQTGETTPQSGSSTLTGNDSSSSTSTSSDAAVAGAVVAPGALIGAAGYLLAWL